ncbi:MAG: hypothetical protein KAR20_17950, partial [Candidatus Heimdallarchaeota archaeon]|nr:hypothetical protein [Candidatus Heimdallarchaeota archaeon]
VETYINDKTKSDPKFASNLKKWRSEYKADDISETASDLEWFSELAVRYAFGIKPKGKIHRGLKKILDAFRNYAKELFFAGEAFAKDVKAGKVSSELLNELGGAISGVKVVPKPKVKPKKIKAEPVKEEISETPEKTDPEATYQIMEVFHGTTMQFDTFKPGQNWFTSDIEYAKGFAEDQIKEPGRTIVRALVKIDNAYDLNKILEGAEDLILISDWLNLLENEFGKDFIKPLELYFANKRVRWDLYGDRPPNKPHEFDYLKWEAWAFFDTGVASDFKDGARIFVELLKDKGYDGISITEGGYNTYAPFSNEQIEIIDDLTTADFTFTQEEVDEFIMSNLT